MGSIFILGKALIKRNIGITILVGIIFILCTGGMIGAISIQMTTADGFDKAMEKNKSPHFIGIYNKKSMDIVKTDTFLKNNHLVESYSFQPSGEAAVKAQSGKFDDIMITLVEYSGNPNHDRISLSKGKVKDAPGLDEVWIPTGLSTKYGIKTGDKMTVNMQEGKKEYLVSAIVFDPLYSSSMISPSRVWVCPGKLSLLPGSKSSENVLMSVRLKDNKKLNDFKSQLDKTFPDLLSSLCFDYVTFKMMTNLFNNVISMILLVISVILILISAGIVFFVILEEVINDYACLGVFKGLGFSNKKLKAVNFCRYMMLLLEVMPVGFTVGALISNGVVSQYREVTGGAESHVILALPTVITIFAIAAIMLAAVNFSMRKLKKLEPANAIRFGYARRSNKNRWKIMLPNIALDLALREIRMYRFKSLIKITIICIFAMILFSVGLLNSAIGEAFSSEDITIGIPHCDIILQSDNTLSVKNGEQILKKTEKAENIKTVVPLMMGTQAFVSNEKDKASVFVHAFDSFSGNTDLCILEGRNPKNDFEAAVSVIALNKLGKNVGDMITINIEGVKSTFLITGSYQITSNMGRTVRITCGAYQKAIPNMGYNCYAVSIKDGSDVTKIKQSLQRILGEKVTVSITKEFIGSFVGGIIKGVNFLNIILTGIMALICGASLFNIVQLHVIENRKTYGIFKGFGMPARVIKRIQYIKMLVISVLGIVTGMALTWLFAPLMIGAMFASSGLKKVSYSFSLSGMLLTLCITCMVVLASTFLALRRQGRTNLRELIIE